MKAARRKLIRQKKEKLFLISRNLYKQNLNELDDLRKNSIVKCLSEIFKVSGGEKIKRLLSECKKYLRLRIFLIF